MKRQYSAAYGEPGWWMSLRVMPADEFPLRAFLQTHTAHALFRSPEDARLFLNHSGKIELMARRYLDWVQSGANPVDAGTIYPFGEAA